MKLPDYSEKRRATRQRPRLDHQLLEERMMPKATTRGVDGFWAKVSKVGLADHPECWIWVGCLNGGGYGSYGRAMAHRYAWELANGQIPEGMCIDHLCRVCSCVNVAHLEVVTPSENLRRGLMPGIGRAQSKARAAARTHCAHGHPWNEENTHVWRGNRRCRACNLRVANAAAARDRADRGVVPYTERTHCKHGHPWGEESTRRTRGGSRVCRMCQALAMARWKAKRAAS